ncbi:MAG: hypothetical protein LBO82_00635 [Synergistaceae bacterium]|nr:hypothetical protein [Synergistaceae bacterium]
MKLLKRARVMAFLAVCAMTWAGPAWAVEVIKTAALSTHETRAFLVNGKARYSGEYAPVFFGFRPGIQPMPMGLGNGTYTVFIPDSKTVGWLNRKDRYFDDSAGTFQGQKEFAITERSDWYRVGDKEYENQDYTTYLTTNAEEVIPQSTFSAAIGGETLFDNTP